MATSKVKTLLPLDRFAELVGINPLHFNQILLPDVPALTCGQPMFQYSWQHSDAMSREEVALAIAEAENRIARFLGFKLLPTWETDDRIIMKNTKPYTTPWGQPPAYQTQWGYVITGGIETKTLISNMPIAYSDQDGDGYNETATITCVTTVTQPEEIAIYYPGEAGDDDWEIRPIKVSIAAGTATITCKRHQLVGKNKLEAYIGTDEVDGTNNANFLTTVDVYRHYNDPQQQIQFIWENGCDCGSGDCHAATYTIQNGAIFVRDYRRGLVAGVPASWNTTSQEFDTAVFNACRSPDKARLWYRAGLRSQGSYLRMAPEWERIVANFAMALMDRPICACSSLEHVTRQAQEDLALKPGAGGGDSFLIAPRDLDNPFGTMRGAIDAWHMVKNSGIGQAVDVHLA